MGRNCNEFPCPGSTTKRIAGVFPDCVRYVLLSGCVRNDIKTAGSVTDVRRCCGSDCNQTCDEGALSDDCTHCVCVDDVIYGQVLSDESLPLANVTVTPADAPYVTLAVTADGGYFNISTGCSNELYQLSRDGYVTTVVSVAESGNVTMPQVGEFQKIERSCALLLLDPKAGA